MRLSVSLLTGATAWSIATASMVDGQTPVFRSTAENVAIYATVRDATGRLVPDLERDAFQVVEDGRPVPVTVFSRDPQPLSVAMMLDMSQGSSWGGANLRGAVLSFVDALRPVDRMSLGSFGLEIAVGANLTRDRAEVARVLEEEMWHGGGTPLWEALRAAMSSVAQETGRRVVFVVTDGRDSGGLPGFEGGRSEAERQAIDQDGMVYAVLFENNRDHFQSDEIVSLSEATGGGHVMVPQGSDPAPAMERIAEELRHQYVLGFTPRAFDDRVHKLDVRLTKPGLTATARKSYRARRGR